MFSRSVRSGSKTRIFARDTGEEREFLGYGMSIDADEDLAMVLPIPTPAASREDVLRFVDLSWVDESTRAYKQVLSGVLSNQDTLLRRS